MDLWVAFFQLSSPRKNCVNLSYRSRIRLVCRSVMGILGIRIVLLAGELSFRYPWY